MMLFSVKKTIFSSFILISLPSFASSSDKEFMPKDGVSVNFDLSDDSNNKTELSIKLPTLIAYGFQENPQEPKYAKVKTAVKDHLMKNISSIISFEKDQDCVFKFVKYEEEIKENKIEVKYDVTCKSDLHGKKVKLDFSKVFKNVQKIYYEIEGKQEIKNTIPENKGTIIIK